MRVPLSLDLQELQECFRQIHQVIEFMDVGPRGNPDLRGRRFVGAGDAIGGGEFLTRGQVSQLAGKVKDLEERLLKVERA